MKSNSHPSVSQKLFSGISIVAILTACLYASGLALHEGFLSAMQLNENKMSLNFHQLVYRGALIVSPYLIVTIIIVSFFLFMTGSFFNPIVREFLSVKKRKSKLQKWARKNVRYSKSELNLMSVAAKCILLVALIYFLILILMFAEKEGMSKGKAVFNAALKESNAPVISTAINGKETKLYFLACATHSCAGKAVDTDTIHYFPSNEHYSFTIREGKNHVVKSD